MSQEIPPYPVSLEIDFPETVDRLTTFFRIFTVIPIMIVLALVKWLLAIPHYIILFFLAIAVFFVSI